MSFIRRGTACFRVVCANAETKSEIGYQENRDGLLYEHL